MSDTSSEDPSHRRQGFLAFIRKWQQTIVYVVLGCVVVLVIGLDQYNRANDDRSRCEAGEDNRNVQRATVEAVYQLATSSIQEGRLQDRNLTLEEIEQINDFISDSNQFRREMYNRIKPSELCLEYVDDVNVEPPSPDLPVLPTKPATPESEE